MSAFLSSDPAMYDAYLNGKDLYAKIASAALGVSYEDCLEFYPDGYVVNIDGKEVVSGSGKEFEVKTDENNSITIKYYEILETTSGEKAASALELSDKIISNIGELAIKNIIKNDNLITIYF